MYDPDTSAERIGRSMSCMTSRSPRNMETLPTNPRIPLSFTLWKELVQADRDCLAR